MSIGKWFDKLDDIVYEPVKLLTDWAREPLKAREHERSMKKELREKETEAELEIRKETEVARIIAEIEEMRKDKEMQRMNQVTEAITKYQKELTRLNVDAISAIGDMQLDLRNRAQDMVYEKTLRYKELQDAAIDEAHDRLKRVESDFSENEAARKVLMKGVDTQMTNILNTASRFLEELNNDIKEVNQEISLLSRSGQQFIQDHLREMRQISTSRNLNQIAGVDIEPDLLDVEDAKVMEEEARGAASTDE